MPRSLVPGNDPFWVDGAASQATDEAAPARTGMAISAFGRVDRAPVTGDLGLWARDAQGGLGARTRAQLVVVL
jgi:hypothetical protein